MELYTCSHTLIVGVRTVAGSTAERFCRCPSLSRQLISTSLDAIGRPRCFAGLSGIGSNCGHYLSNRPYPLIYGLVDRIVRYVAPMTEPQDPLGAFARPSHVIGDASRYLLLVAMQTIGATILFLYAVPLFRQVLLDPGSHVPQTRNLVWSLSAITLMQAGYWIRNRLRRPLPQLHNALFGHIVLFVARMSFVLATSVFGFVFIVRRPELEIPMSRYFVLLIGLFALFCYTRELEQRGRALIGPSSGKETGN